MKAVVLVGGEGTRLRPLTETVPKPLLPFMNRAFLDHVLEHLAAHGVGEAILSSSYLERDFRPFLGERGGLPPHVTWIAEDRPLGTGGAAAAARRLLDDTFLVLNGDVLSDIDLTALVEGHRERGALGTIALVRVEDARPYGLVETDADGRVLAFREKPSEPVTGTVNAGAYVLEPRALDGVLPAATVSIERETFPGLIERGEGLFATVWEGYWRDLGTPEAYLQAHLDALDGLIGGPFPRPLVADGALVDEAAYMGETVVLGPGARVAAGAKVERSVLHAAAAVGEGATVQGCILGPGASVGGDALVRDCVLAEGAGVAPGAHAEGARIGPGETLGGRAEPTGRSARERRRRRGTGG